MPEMPLYDCHQQVRALKVKDVIALIGHPAFAPEGTKRLVFEDDSYPPVEVTPDFVAAHHPAVGGYYLQYGPRSFGYCPEEEFESGYSLIEAAKHSKEDAVVSVGTYEDGWTIEGDRSTFPDLSPSGAKRVSVEPK